MTASRAARENRCPDGGYCHGDALNAGSPPCVGACYRVLHAGPLSGVYPGDRWPPDRSTLLPRTTTKGA